MYLMYVDESGDCGLSADGSATRFFCLSGVIIHELYWRDAMDELIAFRRKIKRDFRVYLEAELHAADLINKPSKCASSLAILPKHQRLAILRQFANIISLLPGLNIINVVIDKQSGRLADKSEVFRWAWFTLFQRFENTISRKNFPGPKNESDRGIIFPDNTDGEQLTRYLDEMRKSNRLKIRMDDGSFHYEDKPIKWIIESPVTRDSKDSYFIQVADCAVFLLKQSLQPCVYMKTHGGCAYFKRLEPVLCKFACSRDPLGIVRL